MRTKAQARADRERSRKGGLARAKQRKAAQDRLLRDAEARLGGLPDRPGPGLFERQEVPSALLKWLESFLVGAGYFNPAKRGQALRLVRAWLDAWDLPAGFSLCGGEHPVPNHLRPHGEPCPVCDPLGGLGGL